MELGDSLVVSGIKHAGIVCLLQCHVSVVQLVERANKWSAELGMQDSVHFLFTNVSVSLAGGQNCWQYRQQAPQHMKLSGLGLTCMCWHAGQHLLCRWHNKQECTASSQQQWGNASQTAARL
jgi:hypothetical protein